MHKTEYVRTVDYFRAPLWEKATYNQARYGWLPKGDYPLDLIVKDCRIPKEKTVVELSVFKLENRAYLDRILAGWAVVRGTNEGVGFIIFDESIPMTHNIKISYAPGTTADPDINKLHRNLEELTNSRTANLVNDFVLAGTVDSRTKEDLEEIVVEAHTHGYLSLRNRIRPYWKTILGF